MILDHYALITYLPIPYYITFFFFFFNYIYSIYVFTLNAIKYIYSGDSRYSYIYREGVGVCILDKSVKVFKFVSININMKIPNKSI